MLYIMYEMSRVPVRWVSVCVCVSVYERLHNRYLFCALNSGSRSVGAYASFEHLQQPLGVFH